MTGIEFAQNIKSNSYSPYSHFRVGACVEFAEGAMVGGVNVENASYGLTICAERVAITSAVAMGYDLSQAVCIYICTDSDVLTPPCGACLQVMSEFWEDIRIVLCNDSTSVEYHLSDLLPHRFGKENIG